MTRRLHSPVAWNAFHTLTTKHCFLDPTHHAPCVSCLCQVSRSTSFGKGYECKDTKQSNARERAGMSRGPNRYFVYRLNQSNDTHKVSKTDTNQMPYLLHKLLDYSKCSNVMPLVNTTQQQNRFLEENFSTLLSK